MYRRLNKEILGAEKPLQKQELKEKMSEKKKKTANIQKKRL